MTIDEMLELSQKANTDIEAWNTLEDYITTLSYGRVNQILEYLPPWGGLGFDIEVHGPLRSMCDDAREEMEREAFE